MGLEVFYPSDIRNALLAAEQAVNATADATGNEDDPFTAGFLTGYPWSFGPRTKGRAALTTLALAFGLPACLSGIQGLAAQPEISPARQKAPFLAIASP
jgi:hypothetical protein